MSAEIGERLIIVRGDMVQEEFAEKMGISRMTLVRYEKGIHRPSSKFLLKLSNDFGVDPNWLLFGEGEAPKPELSSQERILLDHFRHCDKKGREAMLTAGAALAQPKDKKDIEEAG